MMRPKILKVLLFILILLVIILIFFGIHNFFQDAPRHGKGIMDFVGYWAAFQLFQRAQNPYDYSLQAGVEQSIHYCCSKNETYSVWNAPWTFVLFYPFLAWPFAISASLWFVCNLVLPTCIAALIWKGWSPGIPIRPIVLHLSGICLLPYLYLMLVGQTSLWPILGWAGCFWALEKKRDDLAGLFLTLTTIKPHIGYLLYPVLFIWILRTRRFRVMMSAMLGLAALSFLAETLHPGVFLQRLHMKATPLVLAAATLETQIRLLLFRIYGEHILWPALAVPLITLFMTVFYYRRRPVVLKNAVPPLLCISLLTAPYGGINDFNLLAITQVAWLGRLFSFDGSNLHRTKWLGVFGIYQLFTLSAYLFWLKGLYEFWWYPLGYLILWIFVRSPMPDAIKS
jgi:Glycosyltransferase family 87